MRINKKATYSFEEAVKNIVEADLYTIEIIASVISEERHYYCLVDLISLEWIFKAKFKELYELIGK